MAEIKINDVGEKRDPTLVLAQAAVDGWLRPAKGPSPLLELQHVLDIRRKPISIVEEGNLHPSVIRILEAGAIVASTCAESSNGAASEAMKYVTTRVVDGLTTMQVTRETVDHNLDAAERMTGRISAEDYMALEGQEIRGDVEADVTEFMRTITQNAEQIIAIDNSRLSISSGDRANALSLIQGSLLQAA